MMEGCKAAGIPAFVSSLLSTRNQTSNPNTGNSLGFLIFWLLWYLPNIFIRGIPHPVESNRNPITLFAICSNSTHIQYRYTRK